MRIWWSSVPTASNDDKGYPMAASPSRSERRRVRIVPGGPILIEGPVEIMISDGTAVASDRFMVAICLCRHSRRFPLCDTSHRRHTHGRKYQRG
jgi:hypothetical protein